MGRRACKGGDVERARGTPRTQMRSLTMLKALAKSRNHPKVEECCDMPFEGLSPELMLCVQITGKGCGAHSRLPSC